MIGTHRIKIQDVRVCYDFEIKYKITLIRGESGSGKSTLIRLVQRHNEGVRGVKVESDYKLVAMNLKHHYDLSCYSNCIIFIDESSFNSLKDKTIISFINNSDNYFVIVSRKDNFYEIPYSIDAIMKLNADRKNNMTYNTMSSVFSRHASNDFNNVDIIVCEDSQVGCNIIEKAFTNTNIISSNGNSNICFKVEELLENKKNFGIMVDSAAFGPYIERIIRLRESNYYFTIVAPECIEQVILFTKIFYNSKDKVRIVNPFEFADISKFVTLERYYIDLLNTLCIKYLNAGYSKSKLPVRLNTAEFFEEIKMIIIKL